MKHYLFFVLFLFSPYLVCAQIEEIYTLPVPNGKLGGSLIVSDTLQSTPVVLLIPGSGPTDKDGNNPYAKNNSLKMLAEALASHKISSLRIDKRGIGSSKISGLKEQDMIFDDFVSDVVKWINKLQNDKRFSKIIIAGHSQGALVGLLAANKTNVSGFISIAGAGYPIATVVKKQFKDALPVIQNNVGQIIDSLQSGYKVAKVSPILYNLFRPQIQDFWISWMQYDPANELQKCQVPTLIIQGDTDLQVSIENSKRLKMAKPEAKLIIINEMNHILKKVSNDRSENLATYNNPKLDLHPDLVNYMVSFIKELN